jgi:hypothetical protein
MCTKELIDSIKWSIYGKRLTVVYSHDVAKSRLLFYYVSVHIVDNKNQMVFTIKRINAKGEKLDSKGWKELISNGKN